MELYTLDKDHQGLQQTAIDLEMSDQCQGIRQMSQMSSNPLRLKVMSQHRLLFRVLYYSCSRYSKSVRPSDCLSVGFLYGNQTFRTMDDSYHGLFVPSLDFSYRRRNSTATNENGVKNNIRKPKR